MKIFFNLEKPFVPPRKCGAEIAAAGLIGGLGLAGSLVNAGSTASTNSKSMNWQSKENEKNREFSASEADKTREWTSAEWLRQFEAQRTEWYNQLAAQQEAQRAQFDYEAEYNTPKNQVARLSQAGFNASAAMGGQGSSGLVSAATGNISSAPSPVVPTGGQVSSAMASPVSSGAPNVAAPKIDLGSLGDFMAQSVKAYKENATLRPQIEQMWKTLALTSSQIAGQELANSFQETQNYIAKVTKNYKVWQSYLDVALAAEDINLKASQGKAYDAEAFEKTTEAFLNLAKRKLTKQQYLAVKFEVDHQQQLFDANLDRIKSESSENYASANANNALAEKYRTEVKDINERLVTFMTEAPFEYGKKKYDYVTAKKNYEVLKWKMPALIHQAYLDNMVSKAEYQQIMHKIKNLDQDTYEKIFRNIEKSKMIDARTSPINWILQYLGGETLARLFAGGAL